MIPFNPTMGERKTLYFARPYHVEIKSEPIHPLASHQLLVRTIVSAISAGTELLFYRGQVPHEMSVDANIAGMEQGVHYPLPYGYCSAGEVVAIGRDVDATWQGRRVFAFHPHTSCFITTADNLHPIPDSLSDEQAVLLPNMETAVNFTMDARPLIGERIVIMGLGVVGLLTLHVLRKYPTASIAALDVYAKRRDVAKRWGADIVLSPTDLTALHDFDPDLILEVSSQPNALASAIDLAGYGSRIVIGSWYGDKIAHLPLGGKFHRNRVQLVSSQVSTIDGSFSNRWDKARRLETAWKQLHDLKVDELITHRVPIDHADEAYQLLDQLPDEAIQILLTY